MKKFIACAITWILIFTTVAVADMSCSISAGSISQSGESTVSVTASNATITSYKLWHLEDTSQDCVEFGSYTHATPSNIVYDFFSTAPSNSTSYKLCSKVLDENTDASAMCSKVLAYSPSNGSSSDVILPGPPGSGDITAPGEVLPETSADQQPAADSGQQAAQEDSGGGGGGGGSSALPIVAGVLGGLLGLLGLSKLLGNKNKDKAKAAKDGEACKPGDTACEQAAAAKRAQQGQQPGAAGQPGAQPAGGPAGNFPLDPNKPGAAGANGKIPTVSLPQLCPRIAQVKGDVLDYITDSEINVASAAVKTVEPKAEKVTKGKEQLKPTDEELAKIADEEIKKYEKSDKEKYSTEGTLNLCGFKQGSGKKTVTTINNNQVTITLFEMKMPEKAQEEWFFRCDDRFCPSSENSKPAECKDTKNPKNKGKCPGPCDEAELVCGKQQQQPAAAAGAATGGAQAAGTVVGIDSITGMVPIPQPIIPEGHRGPIPYTGPSEQPTIPIIPAQVDPEFYPQQLPGVDAPVQIPGMPSDPGFYPSAQNEKYPPICGMGCCRISFGDKFEDTKTELNGKGQYGNILAMKEKCATAPKELEKDVGKKGCCELVKDATAKAVKAIDETYSSDTSAKTNCDLSYKTAKSRCESGLSALNSALETAAKNEQQFDPKPNIETSSNNAAKFLNECRTGCKDANVNGRKQTLECADNTKKKAETWITGLDMNTKSVPPKELRGPKQLPTLDEAKLKGWLEEPGCYAKMKKEEIDKNQYEVLKVCDIADCADNAIKLDFINRNNHFQPRFGEVFAAGGIATAKDNWLIGPRYMLDTPQGQTTNPSGKTLAERITASDQKDVCQTLRQALFIDAAPNRFTDETDAALSKKYAEDKQGNYAQIGHGLESQPKLQQRVKDLLAKAGVPASQPAQQARVAQATKKAEEESKPPAVTSAPRQDPASPAPPPKISSRRPMRHSSPVGDLGDLDKTHTLAVLPD